MTKFNLVSQLNADWRVMDDGLQWILQRRTGRKHGVTPSGRPRVLWRSESWSHIQGPLIRSVREKAFKRILTKRYTGRRKAEFLPRPVEYPIYEVGQVYENPGLDMSVVETLPEKHL